MKPNKTNTIPTTYFKVKHLNSVILLLVTTVLDPRIPIYMLPLVAAVSVICTNPRGKRTVHGMCWGKLCPTFWSIRWQGMAERCHSYIWPCCLSKSWKAKEHYCKKRKINENKSEMRHCYFHFHTLSFLKFVISYQGDK